jgi:hypothetical protein
MIFIKGIESYTALTDCLRQQWAIEDSIITGPYDFLEALYLSVLKVFAYRHN